jgi:hypothetical protein
MAKPTTRDEKLASKIIEEFRAAEQRGDLAAFTRLLGTYGAHLPRSINEDLIKDFKKNAALLRDALRDI